MKGEAAESAIARLIDNQYLPGDPFPGSVKHQYVYTSILVTYFFSLQLLREDDEVFHKIKDVMRLSERQGSLRSMIIVCSFF